MECNFFQLYFLLGTEKCLWGISPHPLLDLTYFKEQGYRKMIILTEPIPLPLAEYLLQLAQEENSWWKMVKKQLGFSSSSPEAYLEKRVVKLQKELKKRGLPLELAPREFTIGQSMPNNLENLLQEVWEILQGRILFASEAERALQERGFSSTGKEQEIIYWLSLAKKANWQRGIGQDGQCQRCGGKKLEAKKCWWGEGLECLYCPQCATMGQCRLCSLLYSFPSLSKRGQTKVTMKMNFSLTPAQERASKALEEFLDKEEQECLLWAVCGAGKTEVVYGAIRKALAQGRSVLLAIPRQEVVRELFPRLQATFPQTKIAALYGGSGEKYSAAQLVIATTHQALRFYQYFPLVILDEVDAYPYRENAMLQYGVQRASCGKTIYLTATPEKKMLKLATITIPARHHGFPLPEPELAVLPLPKGEEIKEKGLPQSVLDFLEESVEKDQCQVFIFLPTIKLTVEVGQWLQDYYWRTRKVNWVEFSHSKDPEREQKKERFSQGQFPFLVTTTIMERGVTIPRLNVLVLYSDQERIFNIPALIQMAGRVGRKKEYPQGRVLLVGNRTSSSMLQAKAMVKNLNREAQREGYLKVNLSSHASE